MNSLSTNIEYTIEAAICDFSEALVKTLGLDPTELAEIWLRVKGEHMNPIQTKALASTEVSTKKSTDKSGSACPRPIVKGPRRGQPCGVKSVKDSTYCKRHSKFESGEPPAQRDGTHKKSPSLKKTIKPKSKSRCPGYSDKTSSLVIELNSELNMYWHPSTQLIFKSRNERVVVAKEDSGEMIPLSDFDRETCVQWRFTVSDTPFVAPSVDVDPPERKYDSSPDGDCNGSDRDTVWDLVADTKFWRGETTGSVYTVTYGKKGTLGRIKTTECANRNSAVAELTKTAQAKISKGYVRNVTNTTGVDSESASKEAHRAARKAAKQLEIDTRLAEAARVVQKATEDRKALVAAKAATEAEALAGSDSEISDDEEVEVDVESDSDVTLADVSDIVTTALGALSESE